MVFLELLILPLVVFNLLVSCYNMMGTGAIAKFINRITEVTRDK